MKKTCLCIGFWLLYRVIGYSQYFFPQESNADCMTAIELDDSLFGPTVPPEGYGQKLEIAKNPSKNVYLFEQEHNTLWYKFEALYSTELTFDIIPVDTTDDLDFLLFKYIEKEDFCNMIYRKEVMPARSNMAKSRSGTGGFTGLSSDGSGEYVPSGPGYPYSKSLFVNEGDVFYLVVDNYTRQGKGHSLHFHYTGYPKAPENISVKISIRDAKNGKKLKGDVNLLDQTQGEKNSHSLVDKLKQESLYRVDLEKNHDYLVQCNAPGYFFYTGDLRTAAESGFQNIKVNMKQIREGEKLSLHKIAFYPDSTAIMPSSLPDLENLHGFMKLNPKVKIEIQGHVNAPNTKCTREIKQFSEERAKAVYDYLMAQGIKPEKMEYKGYGNKEMIYIKPNSEEQEQANRRVDIMILKMLK